jgi:hypothetical protein
MRMSAGDSPREFLGGTSRTSVRSRARALARTSVSVAAGFLFVSVVAACGKTTVSAAVTRKDSARVEIISNAAPDRSLGWSVDSVLDLRSPTGRGADTVGFFEIWDVAVARGRIVVLDGSQPGLFVYDTLGHLQGRYGRKGKGPGELTSPVSMGVTSSGGVGVADLTNRRVELFDSSFKVSGSIPLMDLLFYGGEVRFSDGALILPLHRAGRLGVAFSDLAAVGPTDTTVMATLRQPAGKMVSLKSCDTRGDMLPIFTPTLRWAVDTNGGVLVSDGSTYDIDVYSGSGFTLAQRIRRNLAPIQGTKALASESWETDMSFVTPRGQRLTCDPEEVATQIGFASVIPPVTAIKASPNDEIWASRWVPKGHPPLLDVFDSTGAYMGSLTNMPMPAAFLGNDRVIVERKDTLDVPFLTIYRVVH